MSVDHPAIAQGLRAMRDHDLAGASSFEAALAERVATVRPRSLRVRTFVAAGAAAAAIAWLALLRPQAPDPATVTWAAWRSPTAALLAGNPALASFRSPTSALTATRLQ